MPHRYTVKVYYEDTDAGGVVYYANYLRYMERARTEYFLEHGINIPEFHGNGVFFVVTRLEATYRRPARLGETLDVTSKLLETKTVKATLRQQVLREGELLVDALLGFACIDKSGKPLRLPAAIEALAAAEA